jgi:dolichyl-phosphate beta-glucosyltransferase
MHKNKIFNKWEIVIVDDGSKDDTIKIVKKFSTKYSKNNNIRILENKKNMGKGYSVKRGALNAKYNIILFSDADMSTPISELSNFTKYISDYDVIIGTRTNKDKIKIKQPTYRLFIGKIFSIIKHIILGLNITDTQCGFKIFKGNKIFRKQKVNRFAFDVELLYLAKKNKLKIKELDVVWKNDLQSKVRPFRDSWNMLIEIIKIKRMHG